MPWQPIPSVTEPHYLDTNLNQIQKCVNWYLEKTSGGYVVKNVPGLQGLATAPNFANCLGAIYDPLYNVYLFVNGGGVYKFDPVGVSYTLVGSISNFAFAAVGGSGKVLMTNGANGYIYDILANTFTQIVDANFTSAPQACVCFNGQFIVVSSNAPYDRWFMSAVDDGLTWTPVISARNIYNPDQTRYVIQVRDTVYFIGARSTEIWSPSTVDPFLQPISGAALPIGIPSNATRAVSKMKDDIFLYAISGNRGAVYKISGGSYVNVTPPYIQDRIGDLESAVLYGTCYSNCGQDFYELNISDGGSGSAWLYNITSDTWSEVDASRKILAALNTNTSGEIICALYTSPNLYTMGTSSAPYNQFGGAITRVLDFKIDGGINRTVNQGLRFEFEAQHDSSSSYTLSATLQKSDDAGRTFDTGITLSRAITNGTSAQQVLLQSPPLGGFKAGRIYRLTLAGPAARLILRRAEGLVRVGRF